MTKPTILISGASVAGPALAYFLRHNGYDVTVVERAPHIRDGGYPVDFRGAAIDVLAEMNILERVREHETVRGGTTVVDAEGAKTGELPAERFAGDLEVPKQELTRILHDITADDVEYVFSDSITQLTQHDSGVVVEFERGRTREFDLVVGADGVHSAVRRLVFEPDGSALRHLGMSGAAFTTENFLGIRDSRLFRPGRSTAIYLFGAGHPDRLTVSLSFATTSPKLDRADRAEQEHAVRTAFAGQGWEVPRLLDAMSDAEDFTFGSSCQVILDRWTDGRVALVGDAGYCAATPSGLGTSQALIGARTLAHHLLEADGDHETAFATYERQLRPYVAGNQAHGRLAAALFGGANESTSSPAA